MESERFVPDKLGKPARRRASKAARPAHSLTRRDTAGKGASIKTAPSIAAPVTSAAPRIGMILPDRDLEMRRFRLPESIESVLQRVVKQVAKAHADPWELNTLYWKEHRQSLLFGRYHLVFAAASLPNSVLRGMRHHASYFVLVGNSRPIDRFQRGYLDSVQADLQVFDARERVTMAPYRTVCRAILGMEPRTAAFPTGFHVYRQMRPGSQEYFIVSQASSVRPLTAPSQQAP